ncbi:MAG: ChuX/HutX family heme-like substrate-binding protein, partial [Chitinophaga rupis]
ISFRKTHPQVRIRDAARQRQTTEAEILASFAGSSVLALRGPFPDLVHRWPELGYVMVLTRNESCVHERKGVFEEIVIHGRHVGVVTGPDIDLRIFFQQWAFAFVVFTDEEAGFKDSIQIFDHQGMAVLKIFLQQESDRAAFEKISRDFAAEVQSSELSILPAPAPPVYNNEGVDITGFRTDWSELKDTHDFFPMLKRHNISRLHALHIAGDYSKKVNNDTVKLLLQRASADDWEIMIFVANHGNIQIHTVPVKKILEIPGWINVMDPTFNLHLQLPPISETWVVRKPTVDGWVHSLELFDEKGELIVQFFGKRKPGQPENLVWKDWINGLDS